MKITAHESLPVITYSEVLGEDGVVNFTNEIQDSTLDFTQHYAFRLFSQPQHQDWIRARFQHLIDQAQQDIGQQITVQQAFLGLDLPRCNFMLHRSHPAIAAVINYSPEAFLNSIMMLTNSDKDPEDYLNHKAAYFHRDFRFEADTAIMIMNQGPRRHWGYSAPIADHQVKRSVWIYLGYA